MCWRSGSRAPSRRSPPAATARSWPGCGGCSPAGGRLLRVALRRDRRLLRDRPRELTRAHVHVCLFLRGRFGFVSGGCDSVPHIRRQGIGNDVAFTEPRGGLEPYGDLWRAADGRVVNTVCALRCLASG